ncbi:MAG: hypothetical protein QOD42_1401 [Sphingomonadales bacterium]|jgi:hypothetical protein|nr:hypothetical protein [Sphingomonadales bacterium]
MTQSDIFWQDLDRAVYIAGRERQRLLTLPGVVAVGAGPERIKGRLSGYAAIVVTVARKLRPRALKAEGRTPLPTAIDGLPVDVVEQGAPVVAPAEARARERAGKVLERITARWIHKPNVTALGLGYKYVDGKRTDRIAIRVYVARKVSPREVEKRGWPLVPKQLNRIPTDVVEGPRMKPAAASGSRADRRDPLVGGLSIGTANHPFNRGTYGATVFDRASGAPRVLSNLHVLDALEGEHVIQPAPVALDDSVEVGFQLDICTPPHFFRLDTPNTPLGTLLASWSAGAAAAAALSDVIDPTRRGQEATKPRRGALTRSERHSVKLRYPELPIPGTPFRVGASWQYLRETTAGDLSFEVEEENRNPHVLKFKALYTDKKRYRPGETVELMAAIIPPGRTHSKPCSAYHCVALLTPIRVDRLFPVVLREAGAIFGVVLGRIEAALSEEEIRDGLHIRIRTEACLYFGSFTAGEGVPLGPWRHYLFAQTVNNVAEGTPPELAAQTIGGLPASQNMRPVVDVACGPATFEDGQFDIEFI